MTHRKPVLAVVASAVVLAGSLGTIHAAESVSNWIQQAERLSVGNISTTSVRPSVGGQLSSAANTNQTSGVPTMPVNEAVMVTVELNAGRGTLSIAEALRHVERRHQPDDGKGRVFTVLDAYGEPTTDGNKLHISMHVSTEKTGIGTLVYRPTGEVLWQRRVVLGDNTNRFAGKNLTILLDDGRGKTVMVDGSNNPTSILDARLRDSAQSVRDFWPDGVEREVSFLYSSCGCPVKAKARRTGERTMRTTELPVIFPDDPAVLRVIERLMGWKPNG